jgi:excisionase family DNA binding protein
MATKQQAPHPVLTVSEAAEYLGLPRRTVYRLVTEDGEIPHVRRGKKILIPRGRLDEWLGLQSSSKS